MDNEFVDLKYWIDVVEIEFSEGHGICVPMPEPNGKNYVYFDSMVITNHKNLNKIKLYLSYSMENDSSLCAAYVRLRNFN